MSVDHPTFVDLRIKASDNHLTGDAEPFGTGGRIAEIRAGACEVLAVTIAAGDGEAYEDRGDLWVLAQDGEILLTYAQQELILSPGTSAAISRGTTFRWRTERPVAMIGMRYLDAVEGTHGIFAIDNDAPLSPSNSPALDVLTSPVPSCRSNSMFRSTGDEFLCGIWDSTPYQRRAIYFQHCELMHLLEGEVTFTDESDRTATFSKGDTFIIEQGARCTWESYAHVKKIYAYFKSTK
ncbi:cupin domain-containing protein (plasmid) [Sphingobium sp. V4]|uniref:cupin domain-containing protein n=1 Tax=Sphingobium sp. V4 TaxID=3038927 RepID=UPI0025581615|nr:cupin domain-containing protein [Sphingobium sp. V4]WIW90387.1 cupin domain-containing protein [Sphingobium sp. V4]